MQNAHFPDTNQETHIPGRKHREKLKTAKCVHKKSDVSNFFFLVGTSQGYLTIHSMSNSIFENNQVDS